MRQWLIAALALMVARGYALAAEATPLPAPRAGFLPPDQQIIGLRLTHPPATSLHQFAKTSLAMAKRVMVDPQLFAIRMDSDTNFLNDGPSAPDAVSAFYSTPMNLEKYVSVRARLHQFTKLGISQDAGLYTHAKLVSRQADPAVARFASAALRTSAFAGMDNRSAANLANFPR